MRENFGFKPAVAQMIEAKGFADYTPIQRQAIPLILQGKDVIGISPTGTGKSLAFLLPVLQKVDPAVDRLQAVITAPTRELARQLYEECCGILAYDPDYRIKLISSGYQRDRMASGLSQMPHIVIGTVGRLKDLFVDQAVLRLDQAGILVIDEADMTLELGFLSQIDEICRRMSDQRQVLVFSATIPTQLEPFLRRYLHQPVIVSAQASEAVDPRITHVLVDCRHLSYGEKLIRILPGIHPYVCLIFCRTRQQVEETAALMKEHGFDALAFHGDMTARQRRQGLKRIEQDQAVYIVCTDLMARGLDLPSVSHVISLGLPSRLEYYTHRAGRTGRAGRSGTAYTLYQQSDIEGLKQLRQQGIPFVYQDYKNGRWVAAKPFDYRRPRPQPEPDPEVLKITTRPVKQVKPGYRKKRARAVEKVQRRRRREFIRTKIKEEQKERAKAAQRARRKDQ